MKKIFSCLLLLALGLALAPLPLQANSQTQVITSFDWQGTEREIDVDFSSMPSFNLLLKAAHSYGFNKSCDDWQGCPYEITGVNNGNFFRVYRQFYTNSNRNANYSGYIYT